MGTGELGKLSFRLDFVFMFSFFLIQYRDNVFNLMGIFNHDIQTYLKVWACAVTPKTIFILFLQVNKNLILIWLLWATNNTVMHRT